MFRSFWFCHLKKLLYIFKSHLLCSFGNQGGKKSFLLLRQLCCFLIPPLKPTLGLCSPTLPSLICTPNLSHPALYKYIHVLLVLNTDPQFLVQRPGAQTSCGIQTILDFRNRFNIHTAYYKTSGTRASIPYTNSLIFQQLNVPRVIPSEVNEECVSLQAKPGHVLLPNELWKHYRLLYFITAGKHGPPIHFLVLQYLFFARSVSLNIKPSAPSLSLAKPEGEQSPGLPFRLARHCCCHPLNWPACRPALLRLCTVKYQCSPFQIHPEPLVL